MPKHPESAIAAALTRIVADGFVLRFRTESLLWNLAEAQLAYFAILQRAKSLLDEMIPRVALRIRDLGGRSPRSLKRLCMLSSIADGTDDCSGPADISSLADEYRSMLNGCRMVAVIAREDGDATTEQLLRLRIAPLEDIQHCLNQEAPQE